jgi:hypothetical protein
MKKKAAELASAQKRAAEEIQRFAESAMKALAPADELAVKVAQMADVSGKSSQILMLYGEQLKTAAAKQLVLTGTLDDLTIDLIEAYDTMVSMAKGTAGASAAMDELDRIIGKVISEDLSGYLSGAAGSFAKLNVELGKMKPIELFPKNAEGKTPEEQLKDVSGAVNQTIPEVLTSWQKGGDSMAETWRRQVSTIVTDWSRGIADIIMSGQSFGQKLKAMFTDTAKGILRMFIEQLFKPLQNWLSKITDGLFSMSGSSGGGGGGILNSLISGLSKGISGGGAGQGVAIGAEMQAAGSFGTNWLQAGIGTAGTIGGGAAVFGGGISAASAAAMGAGAYGIPLAGAGTGSLAGAGGAAAAGGGGLGGIFGGIGSAFMGIAAAIPVAGWIAIGVAVTAAIIAKVMHKDAFEAGAKEAARDLGGINIGEKAIKAFFTGVGLTEKQAFPIRKDLLTSPAFISQIAVPAAQAQGKLDALLNRLEKVTVDTKIAASGYLDFRAVVEQGIDTGNWQPFNDAWQAAFKNSKALTAAMPDLTALLAAAGVAASTTADAVNDLTVGFQGLRDAITASLPSAKDMYQVFWDTGEILPELSDMILKYGGSLSAWQQAADLPGLRANLAGISSLVEGLNSILPEQGIIDRILGGEGFGATGWGDLAAMGLDPSKLVKMADLMTFQKGWEPATAQFEQSGVLPKGGVLEQGLWQFGGSQGMTALENYGKGFNTITPSLLSSTKAAMDAQYKTERQTVLAYLGTVSEGIQGKIEDIGQAIVDDLDKILFAIQNPGQPLPENLGGPATVPAATTETPAAETQAQNVTIILNGPVYGYDDFQTKVNQAVKSEYYRKGMAYLPA